MICINGRNIRDITELINARADLTPDAIGFVDPMQSMTFGELRDAAMRVSRHLDSGPICIYMAKSVRALAVMLGAAAAGGWYSVIDTSLNAAGARKLVSLLEAKTIAVDDDLLKRAEDIFGGMDVELISASSLLSASDCEHGPTRCEPSCINDTRPLYCNFTSGSSGNPKGVIVSHRSVLDFVASFIEVLDLSEDDVFANQAPFDYDASVKDIYTSIALGARALLIPRHYFADPAKLVDFITRSGATILVWAASALAMAAGMHAFDEVRPDVRIVFYSGEVLPLATLRYLRQQMAGATIINGYGHTETTCNCTYHVVRDEDLDEQDMPIGRPFPNKRVFLLDGDKEITEPGHQGEICVAGSCLALGYLKMPDAPAFTWNPANRAWKEPIYRSGDVGEWGEDGELRFRGRIDFEIKRHGRRVELNEIERVAEDLPNGAVDRACCMYEKERDLLVLFYAGSIDEATLALKLKELLPGYMVPTKVRRLGAMPVNKNGKIDRASLRALVSEI